MSHIHAKDKRSCEQGISDKNSAPSRKNQPPPSLPHHTAMKTILIILITLIFSQYLYSQHGTDHPLAHFTRGTCNILSNFLHTVLDVME